MTQCFRYFYCSFVGPFSLKEAGGLGEVEGIKVNQKD